MPQHNDRSAFILALLITCGLGWGMVYFVRYLWPRLPGWLALILFILLATMVIGYPIYALARWSDRYLQRRK
ncbi:MAG: hypothetical protein H6970_04345 [Gammaproteobacteria bacterium]|nr:hypothetical protein [Gammaproteobacteria bacterium]MCP5424279.1 hypothetical protein [Gammaproteobacteria bacterium]MCP5459032.1 hypothetical protein [Gammaproteobacteria bacterium]